MPDEKTIFGQYWCGQEDLVDNEFTLVARYPKDKDGDGQSVDVHCCPVGPARFYRLVVAPGSDSAGKTQDGYTITTGSSSSVLAATLAEAIAGGLLSFRMAVGVGVLE